MKRFSSPFLHLARVLRCLWRLCMSPVTGAISETRRAWTPDMESRHGLFALVSIRFFAPASGAVKGLAHEMKRLCLR